MAKAQKSKWWRVRYSTTHIDEIDGSQTEDGFINIIRGKTKEKTPLDDGYTSYHKTLREAIEHKTKRLERAIEMMELSGDNHDHYKRQLEEMSKYE